MLTTKSSRRPEIKASDSLPDPIYTRLEQRLVAWAAAREDIRAVVVIGSRARADHPSDAWSDLDTLAFVADRSAYAPGADWQAGLERALGLPVWFAAFNETGRGDLEVELVLEGGLKVDIVFSEIRAPQGLVANLSQMIAAAPYHSIFGPGMRVLLEKAPGSQPTTPGVSTPLRVPPALPDQGAFDNRVANSLLNLLRAAKLCRRGELWRAVRAINYGLQDQLLGLLEWHTRSGGGQTWPYGRFLEQWADPRALQALPACIAGYSPAGIRSASLASLELIAWLSGETTQRLGLRDPIPALHPVFVWLKRHWD